MNHDMSDVIFAHKELGETPLQCLNRYRAQLNISDEISMTYAGRLDPAATGQLVLLVGGKVHQKEQYMHMNKKYRAEVLFGVSTDSYDVLGLIDGRRRSLDGEAAISPPPTAQSFDSRSILALLHEYIGEITLPYPPFSSRTVAGKSLWSWAREERLDEIRDQWPMQTSTIHAISYDTPRMMDIDQIMERVNYVLRSVSGDFRQEEIERNWREYFEKEENNKKYFVLPITITCSSGTYIRSIAHDLGERLGVGACLYSLERFEYLEKRIM